MVNFYVTWINNGLMTIDQVPAVWRPAVQAALGLDNSEPDPDPVPESDPEETEQNTIEEGQE
jgi:hypothetical protein